MATTSWLRSGLLILSGTGLALAVAPIAAGQGRPRGAVLAEAPAPVPPATVSRTSEGAVTIRAVRIPALTLDGRLDEEVYADIPPVSDFVQQLPIEGEPATERTEAWVMFDDENMFIAARCWDSAPPEQWIANEMRRDSSNLIQNDNFGVLFDTFHDRRNAFYFYANPLGGRSDYSITDEGNLNVNWNATWEVRTGRFPGGWTIEIAIPFKSLRYTSGQSQIWGINMRRTVRRKNEYAYLTRIPASLGGGGGSQRISAAATLVGLDLPAASKNLELKPYAISTLTTDRLRKPPLSNDLVGDFGADVKYGVTANLTADLTYNTDFAQVEVDEQQVNLTRFSLVFPEKRDFFLEGSGVMDFGRGAGALAGNANSTTSITPALFYSRRVGLDDNRVVPIDVGGRLTGKVGRLGIGAMNIQTGEETVSKTPATNFTVLRLKRDILRRSSIGAMFTNRSKSVAAPGANQAFGVDAAFLFFQNVSIGAYLAKTTTPLVTRDDTSYQARFDYGHDRYGARAEYLRVGDNFNPEVGFVRRDNFKRSFGSLRFSPRPKSMPIVRKFTSEASMEYIQSGAGTLETNVQTGRFNIEFVNSDQFTVNATREYELLVRPFVISGVAIPPGDYQFSNAQVTYAFGQQRRASGSVSWQAGDYYDGTLSTLALSSGRVSVTNQLSLQPTVSVNRVELPQGDFTATLIRMRADYAFSPQMFAIGLVQYGSTDNSFSTNLRFRWEYTPGSELFAVYTDERDTRGTGFPFIKNRALVVKINRMFRF